MQIVAEQAFDLSYSEEKVRARIFEPVLEPDGVWASLVEIDAPLNVRMAAYGENSLQALTLAVKLLSIKLYSVGGYEAKMLGWKGEFGGDLGVPAPNDYLDFAPYPF
jgi:hypothetical protein